MKLVWSARGRRDAVRLHDFLFVKSPRTAARIFKTLMHAPETLLATPRLGGRVEEYVDREVRRLIISDYEIRYELSGDTIYILAVFHTREDR